MKKIKNILVTGSSTGIGRDVALTLARQGFRVFAGVRKAGDGESLIKELGPEKSETASSSKSYSTSSSSVADAMARRASAPNPNIVGNAHWLVPVILDVTSEPSVKAALLQIEMLIKQSDEKAGLDGLVNNAGVVVSGPLEFIKVEDLRRQFEVNVFGVIAVTQAFLPLLRQAQGRVVTIGSVSGIMSYPFVAPYCASKFAVRSLMDSLRLELKPWNISVSLIEPGPVATPIWEKSLNSARDMGAAYPAAADRLYGVALRTVEETVQIQATEAAVPVGRTTQVILHALNSAKPKRRYVVGKAAPLEAIIGKYMPEGLRDKMIMKSMGLS